MKNYFPEDYCPQREKVLDLTRSVLCGDLDTHAIAAMTDATSQKWNVGHRENNSRVSQHGSATATEMWTSTAIAATQMTCRLSARLVERGPTRWQNYV